MIDKHTKQCVLDALPIEGGLPQSEIIARATALLMQRGVPSVLWRGKVQGVVLNRLRTLEAEGLANRQTLRYTGEPLSEPLWGGASFSGQPVMPSPSKVRDSLAARLRMLNRRRSFKEMQERIKELEARLAA